MAPYLSAGFPPPDELICRDLLPELYMQLGQWDKAERVIKTCITEKAYELNDGLSALTNFVSYRKIAIEALAYIQEHPGCLQRNIYKALSFEGRRTCPVFGRSGCTVPGGNDSAYPL